MALALTDPTMLFRDAQATINIIFDRVGKNDPITHFFEVWECVRRPHALTYCRHRPDRRVCSIAIGPDRDVACL